jgi:hypothetical protein
MKRLIGKLLLSSRAHSLLGAEDYIKQALDVDDKNGMRFHLGLDHALYAELFKRKGDLLKAKEMLGEAIDILGACGADGWVRKYEKEMAKLE